MPGFNTATTLKTVFNQVETTVLEPQNGELLGRQLFAIDSNLPKWTDTYSYLWKERYGTTSDIVDRATDTTTSDVTYHEEMGYIAQQASAVEYSQEEIERAQEASANGVINLDIIKDRADAAHRALSEWEDNLIFNGNNDERKPIYGLTSNPTKAQFQQTSAPVTFDTLANLDPDKGYDTANKLTNWLMDAAQMISLKTDFAGKPLTLGLPPKVLSYLKRSFSKYNPSDNVYRMLQSNISQTFAEIVEIPEFAGENRDAATGSKGLKDMGMIFARDRDIAQIKLPMDIQNIYTSALPDRYGKYYQRYMLRLGLCIKRPQAFVRLNGISK